MAYRTQKSPTGYVLLATSQYVDQVRNEAAPFLRKILGTVVQGITTKLRLCSSP